MNEKKKDDKVRTLRIFQIDSEIKKHSYPNVPYFMKLFETSRSTIMRDLDFLKDRYDAPLEYDEIKKGYYYTNPNFSINTLLLSEGELFTIYTIIPLLEQYKNTPLESSFKNILYKIIDLLPNKIQINTTLNNKNITFIKDPLPKIDESIFTNIFKAIKDYKTVSFDYRSIKNNEYMSRRFDPYHVLCQKGNWYCIGWCYKHKIFNVYALSRMRNIIIEENTFSIKPDFNLTKYIDPDFGIWTTNTTPIKIKLIFSKNINTYILERNWHVNQECHQNEDGSVYLCFSSNQIEETVYWVLGFGSSVKILNPPILKQRVLEEARKILDNN